MSDLLNQAESAIEQLESIRDGIIQLHADQSNKAILDAAFVAVTEAIEQLTILTSDGVKL